METRVSMETFHKTVEDVFELPKQDIRNATPLTLAFVGDNVYDLVVRTVLYEEGGRKLADIYKTDVKSIDKRISMLKDAAKSYKTFSGTANPENTRVKFIYKTDSIE